MDDRPIGRYSYSQYSNESSDTNERGAMSEQEHSLLMTNIIRMMRKVCSNENKHAYPYEIIHFVKQLEKESKEVQNDCRLILNKVPIPETPIYERPAYSSSGKDEALEGFVNQMSSVRNGQQSESRRGKRTDLTQHYQSRIFDDNLESRPGKKIFHDRMHDNISTMHDEGSPRAVLSGHKKVNNARYQDQIRGLMDDSLANAPAPYHASKKIQYNTDNHKSNIHFDHSLYDKQIDRSSGPAPPQRGNQRNKSNIF